MKLSRWARLWMVTSAIWWGGGGFLVVSEWSEKGGPEIPLSTVCESVGANSALARDKPFTRGSCEESQSLVDQRGAIIARKDALVPLTLIWLIAPFALLFLESFGRWIGGGLAKPANKSRDALHSSVSREATQGRHAGFEE